ncbi:hypothetical protein ATE84_2495 [Aquimarina sp. MAR_2010_214]|uniref:hypothetical protein n=1 Tax=Aquimarina sp. MAR_2010_214 TaxID=1250026 RepID=UPI000C707B21|nr:hypothetical protein [Aquimarina sp. MAR_2010_214]PKV50438.1 hypothetical protein ATE84_2495 [Aquimarina sp. MAR_2010_214]
MEEQILKWKEMWQEQKSNSLNVNELIMRLNQMERNAKFMRTFLIIALVILTLASLIFIAELSVSKFYIISYILAFTGAFMKLVLLYRTKYSAITNESDFNNQYFIKKLNKKIDFKTKHLLIYMSVMIVSINFALLGLYEKGTIFNFVINDENRLFFHLATIILFAVAYVINKMRIDKNKRNTLKLIADLENDL